jgi:protein polybromo-1
VLTLYFFLAASQGHPIPPVKPMEPIFHTVPPRPQRLLHSEAYIRYAENFFVTANIVKFDIILIYPRYIEGLTADSQTMSNWERQLNSTKETTKTDEARLPAHWLADNGEHGTSIDALWALRDFMMCDSLGLSKIL